MSYDKYKVNIPSGKAGDWEIKKFTVSPEQAKMEILRATFGSGHGYGARIETGEYTGLYRNGQVIMSDTPDEIMCHMRAIEKAQGLCLVNGLGLGMVAAAMLEKPDVVKVTVIEISPEVIRLVKQPLKDRYGWRLEVVQADAFTWQPPKGVRYDVVWSDIWSDLCTDNLPEMHRLHRKYGRRTDWQGSWGRERLEYELKRGRNQWCGR